MYIISWGEVILHGMKPCHLPPLAIHTPSHINLEYGVNSIEDLVIPLA